jgi:hypothetical protein
MFQFFREEAPLLSVICWRATRDDAEHFVYSIALWQTASGLQSVSFSGNISGNSETLK